MQPTNNAPRRNFLKTTVKGGLALTIGAGTVGSFLESCSTPKAVMSSPYKTGFDQKPLPYSYAALENVIDATTMEIHYTKHAAAYSKNLKEAVQAEGVDAGRSLEDILANISKYSVKMRNNGGGHYNHEMFWQSMRPKQTGNVPGTKLMAVIEKDFTSFANFGAQFCSFLTYFFSKFFCSFAKAFHVFLNGIFNTVHINFLTFHFQLIRSGNSLG